METLIQDIRFGVRRLVKSPGFAFIAIVSLALGVGANAAIFSLVNTVMLRPLPIANPSQVVAVGVRAKNDSMSALSYPNYVDLRDRNDVLSGLIVERFAPISLSRDGNNERMWGYLVSGNYFDVLGVNAFKGRTFAPDEDRTKLTHPVAVIGYGCWQRRFGGDPDLVGKEILLNDHPFRVIGIAPPGFAGTEIIYTPEIWVPLMMDEWIEPGSKWMDDRDSGNLFAIGRMKPGVNPKQAQASLNLLMTDLGREYPDVNEGLSLKLFPPGLIIPDLQGAVVSFAWVLMGAVALVLLIACTNLASLLLARGTERRREVAIRLAIGASRYRLIRQLLTESTLLALAGGAAGILLAQWLVELVQAFKPPVDFPITFALAVDWRVVVFALSASLLTGILFGLLPAMQSTNPDLVSALKDTSSQAGYRKSRMRGALVVAQFALSLVFLIGAGLVVRSLQRVQSMNPGFEVSNRLMMSMDLYLQGYDEQRGLQFYRQVVERAESIPGVRSAAVTTYIPLSLNYSGRNVYAEGQAVERGGNAPSAMWGAAGPGYFQTLGVPLLAGREFTAQDNKQSTAVCVVNGTFVRQWFPQLGSPDEAIGRRVSFQGPSGPFMQIVGVAKDGKYFNIAEDPASFIYTPMFQKYDGGGNLVVRTESDPKAMIETIRREVQAVDPKLPLYDLKTMSEHMSLALFPARIAASVLGGFGLLALILAAIGIYGVTSYMVAQRTREIGIRIALGAEPVGVAKLVLSSGLKLVVIGLGIGLAGAFLLTRFMSSILFAVSPTDPLTFGGIVAILLGVALLACFIPAIRATRVDPVVALKSD
ncbi:MAG TPA: ABC transporter permease [Blastocatellia bacterium]|nr:ABC transporter permease [Blastocatellia bacterium]